MKIRLHYLILATLLSFNFATASENQNYLSFSIGQFDINDSKDSAEYRIEYLSGNISSISFSNLSLKPFYGITVNGDDGMYVYSGLRKGFPFLSRVISCVLLGKGLMVLLVGLFTFFEYPN